MSFGPPRRPYPGEWLLDLGGMRLGLSLGACLLPLAASAGDIELAGYAGPANRKAAEVITKACRPRTR